MYEEERAKMAAITRIFKAMAADAYQRETEESIRNVEYGEQWKKKKYG